MLARSSSASTARSPARGAAPSDSSHKRWNPDTRATQHEMLPNAVHNPCPH
jgi:hypothetical protein